MTRINCFVVLGSLSTVGVMQAAEVGSSFSYQGVLEKPPGTPVDDTCDFRFGLWDAEVAGTEQGTSPQTINGVIVDDGVFTTRIDFGLRAMNGEARWLEIEVQCPGDAGFTTLAPRIELTPATYALRAMEGVGPPNALEVDVDTGRVGINETEPDAILHLGGAAGDDGLMFPDDTLQTTALPAPCGAGQVVKWDNVNELWVCADDVDTDSDTLSTLACGNGQILKWNNGWNCAADLSTDTQNTLDQAYDQGGPGFGRLISADAGPVNVTVPGGTPGVTNALEAVHAGAIGHSGWFENQNPANGMPAARASTQSTVAGASGLEGSAHGNAATRGVFGYNFSSAADAVGVEGEVVGNPNVTNFGVKGTTGSTGSGAAGVKGEATGTSGTILGVHGVTQSTGDDTAGVKGQATGATGRTYGVHGMTGSTTDDASALRGELTAASGKNFGVYGTTLSTTPGASAVRGDVTGGQIASTDHDTLVAVHGVMAVLGDHVAVEGDNIPGVPPPDPLAALIGVRGYSPGITGPSIRVGVEGDATAGVPDPLSSSGVRGWIKASNSDPDDGSAGVVGQAQNTLGSNPVPPLPEGHNGVWGISQSSKITSAGVLGRATDPNSAVYGVHGQSDSMSFSGAGVKGTGKGCSGASAMNIHDGALTVTGPAKTADSVLLPPPSTPIYSCQATAPINCTSGGINVPPFECVDPNSGDTLTCDPELNIPHLEAACETLTGGFTHDCTIPVSQVTVKKACTADPHCHVIGWKFDHIVPNCLVRDDSIIMATIYQPLEGDRWTYTVHVTEKVDDTYFKVRYAAIGNGSVCEPDCLPPLADVQLDYLIINPVP